VVIYPPITLWWAHRAVSSDSKFKWPHRVNAFYGISSMSEITYLPLLVNYTSGIIRILLWHKRQSFYPCPPLLRFYVLIVFMGKVWIASLIVFMIFILCNFDTYFFFSCTSAEPVCNSVFLLPNYSLSWGSWRYIGYLAFYRTAVNLNFQVLVSKHSCCSQHLAQCLPHYRHSASTCLITKWPFKCKHQAFL